MKARLSKGVKDYPPEEMIRRQKIVDSLRKIFERYSYNPLETPIIERYDVLAVKFGAGADSDAMKEVFQLSDQGGRKLGLRFELTLSLARFIAMNPHIKMPFKRYEVGRVYRDGPVKVGRMREFWQCDVDIVGADSVMADAEIVRLSLDAFKELGLDAYMDVNNRKLLNGILEFAGVEEDKRMSAILAIDKLKKLGVDGVREELEERRVEDSAIAKILSIISITGTTQEKINRLRELLNNKWAEEGLKEIEEFFSYFSEEEQKDVIFNIACARGLGYYTGPVYEGYLRDSEMTSSICGGGRYDEMIGLLLQGEKDFPAAGISFGLVPIMEAIKLKEELTKSIVTEVYVIPIGDTKEEAFKVAQKIRDADIECDIDLMDRGISKNLDYADTQEIPYVIFLGQQELEKDKVKLKDMRSGEEELLTVDKAIENVRG